MITKVAHEIYNGCRSAKFTVPGFPCFDPILQALKTSNVTDRNKTFKVTVQQHDRLIILESFAKRWLEHDATREEAEKVITDHNEHYNPDGQYWVSERTLCAETLVGWWCGYP